MKQANIILSGTRQGIKFFLLQAEGTIKNYPHNSTQQMLQNSMSLSRLPAPGSSVFYGDPLHFIEWSCSFKEIRCLNSIDRLFYLQGYIGGEAKSVIEGRAALIKEIMKHLVKFRTSSTRDTDILLYYSLSSGKNFTSGRESVLRRTPNSEILATFYSHATKLYSTSKNWKY